MPNAYSLEWHDDFIHPHQLVDDSVKLISGSYAAILSLQVKVTVDLAVLSRATVFRSSCSLTC